MLGTQLTIADEADPVRRPPRRFTLFVFEFRAEFFALGIGHEHL